MNFTLMEYHNLVDSIAENITALIERESLDLTDDNIDFMLSQLCNNVRNTIKESSNNSWQKGYNRR